MCPSAKHPDSRTKRSLSFRHLRRTLMVDLSWFPVLARDTAATALILESSFLRRSFKELMTDALWYLPEKKASTCTSRYTFICLSSNLECILNCTIDKLRKLHLRKLMYNIQVLGYVWTCMSEHFWGVSYYNDQSTIDERN